MCDLDISEKRKPQDGKIKFRKFGPLDIELRVATIPTAGGVEDIVMRILAAGEPIPLEKMGFSARNIDELQRAVSKPYGLFFVCGPTGSGKTTTLHSVLKSLNTPDTKIWTAEDPVEITQKGLRQVQVNRKAGLDFAVVMKAFLRADPDIIMVGEMRDKETTSIGIEASLTGHLVFATLHTNSAPESIIRLLDMGMDPFNFSDALLGVLAQRLAKRLCSCKQAYSPEPAELTSFLREYCEELMNTPRFRADPKGAMEAVYKDWVRTYGSDRGQLTFYKPVGCDKCGGSGFKGRCGLHELLIASDRLNEERTLRFEIVRPSSLRYYLGGTTGNPVPFYPIQLYKDGKPNQSMVAAYAALTGKTVNIADAYTADGFDFSGTRAFDTKTGYRSKSFLTVPMRNHDNETIGVLQLINALEPSSGAIVPFSPSDQRLAESLASQAAIAVTNRMLINQLEQLFESFINLINSAIDEKSPYTGGHCQRVPVLTMLLAEAVSETKDGPLRDFHMSEKDRYELKIAGLLHDCGKVTTPVHIVDKATKLESIFDRIQLIDTRFEVLKRDAELEALRKKHNFLEQKMRMEAAEEDKRLRDRLRQLDDDRKFLHACNIGGERMRDEDVDRVRRIGQYRWRDFAGHEAQFLSEDEVKNLTIRSGTLTEEERKVINHHIVATIRMLEALPWPKHLTKVPEYAGGHHERMDGKGYPKGLTREQMSVQARCMGIADIFEALTAKDRPYKKGKTLSESLEILGRMRLG